MTNLKLFFAFCFFYSCFFAASAYSAMITIRVSNTQQLHQAIVQANKSGNTQILIDNGTYQLNATLHIRRQHITLQSASGDAQQVILQGAGMTPNAPIGNLILVSAKNVTLSGLTLEKAANHLVQVQGEKDADGFVINNCILRDAYQQLLKVSGANKQYSADNGIIKNSLFEYSAGIGPNWYIGGIDVHQGKNWLVEGNTFRFIASPSEKVAEFAIHFWNGSADNIVRNNLIIDSDRGIGFGLGNKGNQGGQISNNVIIHRDNHHPFADVGIALESSPNTQVQGNVIYSEHAYPNAIEYRFKSTQNVIIDSNVSNKSISARDGASGIIKNNQVSGLLGKASDYSRYLINKTFEGTQ